MNSKLDVEEYLHLAIHASSSGQPHACMLYLKEALQQQPENALATYLLAIQHAQLGLIERAIAGLKTALSITPKLEIARFQLGLLLLDRSLFSAAKEHFAALVAGADDALRLFSEAMIALADNDPKAAQEKLAQGLSRKSSNPALSALMQQVLDKLSKAGPTTASAAGMQSEVSLGVYRQYTVDSV